MSDREAPSNKWIVSQLALQWLRKAKEQPDLDRSYLAQLAFWGLENGLKVVDPRSPSQPTHASLEETIHILLANGPKVAAAASQWLLSNPNLSEQDQRNNLLQSLRKATSPEEAAQSVLEMAYEVMVAESETSPA